jgi:hypothetical protein
MKKSGVDPELLSQVSRVARLTARMTRGPRTDPDAERIFISYRRDESGHAGRLYDWITRSLPHVPLFMDVDSIQPAADFVDRIDEALGSAEILVVLIGPQWLTTAGPERHPRLEDQRDFVRREVTTGLDRNILILPVLVGGAKMPSQGELPDGLEDLARRNAVEISDTRWDDRASRVIDVLRKALNEPVAMTTDEAAERQIAGRVLVTVGEFLEEPDSERDPGDFLIVAAGPGKNDELDFGIEINVGEHGAWCELVSSVFSGDEADVMNQALRLKDLGWTPPAEGAYEKRWLKGMRLTRWWRDIHSNTLIGDFEDIGKAIMGTFVEVFRALPQGVALGWSSVPRLHPTACSEKGTEDIVQTVRAKVVAFS